MTKIPKRVGAKSQEYILKKKEISSFVFFCRNSCICMLIIFEATFPPLDLQSVNLIHEILSSVIEGLFFP